MRIAIASDHGGYRMKEVLKPYLEELGHEVDDCGPWNTDSVDYPDFAIMVARQVSAGLVDVGIMIDGVGIGSTMAANRIKGVRCALCYDDFTAKNSRDHNYANMLCVGGQTIGDALAKAIVKRFLETPYGEERHGKRVAKFMALDEEI